MQAAPGTFDAITHQQRLGIEGSAGNQEQNSRLLVIENLAQLGSSQEDGVTTSRRMVEVWEMCNRLYMRFDTRTLFDERWCLAVIEAAASIAGAGTGGGGRVQQPLLRPSSSPRIIVLGLGTGLAALAAARAGAEVLWVVRVARFAEVARCLVARNDLAARVRVLFVRTWAELPPKLPPMPGGGLAREAHACVTEELGDDPLSEGLLPLARFCHSRLLRSGGAFGPCRLRIFAALACVRTTSACGFDLRAFNIFRTSSGAHGTYDFEDSLLTEQPGDARMLSAPVLLLDLDLSSAPPMPAAAPASRPVRCTAAGVFNCVVWWAELTLCAGGQPVDLGPCVRSPRASCTRARRQRLNFNGYERVLRRDESVTIHASITSDERAVLIEAPPDNHAAAAGMQVPWPLSNNGVMSCELDTHSRCHDRWVAHCAPSAAFVPLHTSLCTPLSSHASGD